MTWTFLLPGIWIVYEMLSDADRLKRLYYITMNTINVLFIITGGFRFLLSFDGQPFIFLENIFIVLN